MLRIPTFFLLVLSTKFDTGLASTRVPYPTLAFASPSAEGKGSTRIPPPPPISMPVWSLACKAFEPTKDPGGSSSSENCQTSMNIVTFAIPVSVAQPKLWAISLYKNTFTKDSFLKSNCGVLQLLKPCQKNLVPVLGKRSGYEMGYSKRDECSKLGFPWTCHKETVTETSGSIELLPDCALYIELELLTCQDAGDHVLALAQVTGTASWEGSKVMTSNEAPKLSLDQSSALYTAQLRKEGII